MKKLLSVIIFFSCLEIALGGDKFDAAFRLRMKQVADAGGLKQGMASNDVERLFGKPHNPDRVAVWLWVEKNEENLNSWRDVVRTPDEYGRGYFLLFSEGKLSTPIPLLLGKDADVLHRFDEHFEETGQDKGKKPSLHVPEKIAQETALGGDDFDAAFRLRMKQVADAGGLKQGMASNDVERIFGKPHNPDRITVWLWVEKNEENLNSWRDVVRTPDEYGRGYFLLFSEGKLSTPIPLLLGKDADVLHRFDEHFKETGQDKGKKQFEIRDK